MEKERKTELKICIHKKKPMSEDAFRRWSPKVRSKISRWVYPLILSTTMSVEILKSDKLIGEYACDLLENGVYYFFGFTAGASKTRVKNYCLFIVEIYDNEKNKFLVRHYKGRLKRYWFRKKNVKGV